MRILRTGALLVAAALAAAPLAEATTRGRATTATTVRGGYVNDISYIPTSAAPTADPDVYSVPFTGGSLWDGDFTGRTVVHGTSLLNVKTGSLTGTYTETFYGTYEPDGRTGSFVTRGAFSSNGVTFVARARIVSGTCGFAGSTGRMSYDGTSVHGGYVGTWRHPSAPPSSAPCAPPLPGPAPV